MLRNRFRKKRGGGFMDDWNAGASSLKHNFETIKNKSVRVAQNTQQGFKDFEEGRKSQLQSRTMPGGLNPFKRRPKDHFARSGKTIGQREVLNPFNPQVQKEALSRQSAYDKVMVDFKKKAPGYQTAGKRRTRKRNRRSRKRNNRKRKTRKKRRGGAIPAPMAYKKRVDKEEEKKQWILNREMQTAKMKGLSKKQEEIKKKLKASFDRQAYWKTPGDAKNKDAIAGFHVRKAMPGIEAAIKGKTLVPRKTRQTRSSSAGRKKRKTRRKRRR